MNVWRRKVVSIFVGWTERVESNPYAAWRAIDLLRFVTTEL
jgi:hypothetical protein